MHNEMKLLAGPKVDINQIRWPKAADFKGNVKNIVFDMEVVQHPFDKFGVCGIAGPGGHVDHVMPMRDIMPMHELWDKWQLNQQFGRGLRDHDKLAIKGCDFFDARPRANFEGVVMRPDIGPLVDAPIKLKMPKVRDHVPGAFKMLDFKNVQFPAFKVRHELEHPAPVKVQKPNPIEALKAFWKDAQKPKPGIGYGHPALKGLIHGRKRRPYVAGFERFEQPISINRGMVAGGFGNGIGLFEMWRDMQPMKLSTAELKERAEREEKEERQREVRRRDARNKVDIFRDNARSYINIMAKQLDEPGANVCQIIANMFSKAKKENGAPDGSMNSLITGHLKARSYTMLGNGHFSRAYQGPDGYAYKINCNHDTVDAWYGYAVNTMYYGEGLVSVPKIDAIAYRGKTYCVKMELLTPVSSIEFNDSHYGINDAFCGSGDVDNVMKYLQVQRDEAIEMMHIIDRTKRESPGARMDVHYQNVMYRTNPDGSKTLVLTDPLAYGTVNMSFYDERLTAANFVASQGLKLAA